MENWLIHQAGKRLPERDRRDYGVRFVESTEAKIFAKAGATGTGSDKIDVYSTLILGANAYGITDVEGGGLETIVKQLGSGGTADPLNQRATAGWKATKSGGTSGRTVHGAY